MNRITSTGIPEREFNAVKQFLLRSTVPLVYESGDVAEIQGTGCLFERSGHLYFVTAGHVLEGLNPEALGIPLRQIDSEVFTLGEGLMGWSRNEVSRQRSARDHAASRVHRMYLDHALG